MWGTERQRWEEGRGRQGLVVGLGTAEVRRPVSASLFGLKMHLAGSPSF